MNTDDLQIVVLEDLKHFWDVPEVRELYCEIMQVKFDGYGSVYGDNVISSDKADFFGTHLIVCQKGIKLKPLFGYKSVTLDKCKEFHLKFPALSLVSNDGHSECLTKLEAILLEAQQMHETVSFDYSWAQTPNIKGIKTSEMKNLFRDLVMTLVVNHHQDYNIDHMLTCGVVKVKTDLFFDRMGMDKISKKSLFVQRDLNDEAVHIFHARKFSDYAYEMASNYYDLWNNRLEYSLSSKKSSLRKIA